MIFIAFGYDGSVRIKADLNHSPFDRGLFSMTKQVDKFSVTLKKLASTVALAFGTAAIINFGKEAVKAASSLNDAWMGLESIVSGQGKSFSKAKSFIQDYISDGLVPLENAVTAYKNLAARGYSTEQIEKTLVALKDAAAFGRQASYSLGEAVSTATEGLKNENSILVDNAGVTKNVAKMWDEYAKSIGTTANNLTQEQKIQAEVNGILNETRFQTGDAAKLVNTYSGQIALLGYNFQNLKVQVGNALIPIAQAVLPGINAIIAALTKLATVFAQVTALLFGKSSEVKTTSGIASSAGAAADATDKLADATEGAGGAAKQAAKDMKGVLAGFDELNLLADNAASNVGDAAGKISAETPEIEIPSYESEIEEVDQLGEAFQSLGELFVKALDDILAGMPAFRAALLEFAGNFNEFNQKLYDAFTFPGVKERVEQLGRELAEAFNDLVTAIDWELWGRKLGAGLNLGLQFLTEYIYTFDWIGLGTRLAEFINGLVYEVDWYDFGRLLWAQFKIGLETFAGFIAGLDMPALAQAASNIIMGFFNSMQETIANIDWSAIGRQIAEFLNNIDWVGVITSIAGVLQEIVSAGLELVSGFIQNADPEILIAAIAFFAGFLVKKVISTVVAPLAKELVASVIKQIAEAITASGFFEIIGTIGKSIAGIATILAGVSLAVTSFVSMWNEGFSWAKEAVMLLGVALTAVGAIILGAPALVAGVIAGIVATVATAVIVIKDHWEEVKEAFSALMEHISQVVDSIKEKLQEWFDKMKEGWDTYIKPVLDNIIEKFKEVVEKNIKPLIEQAVKLIENVQKVVKALWDNVLVPFLEWLSGKMWQGIATVLEHIGNAVLTAIETISGIITGLLEVLNDVIDFLTGVFTLNFEKTFNGIKEIVSGAIKIVSNIIKGFIDLVKNAVDALLDFIGVSNKASNASPPSSYRGSGFSPRNVSPRMAVSDIPNTYSLPRLANGAVIPPNQQFAAVLGDQRSGMNIEAPLKTIEQAVRNVMGESGFGGEINITVESVLDGKVIAKNVVKNINSMTRSSGKSPLYA